jgi:hypothetical protein
MTQTLEIQSVTVVNSQSGSSHIVTRAKDGSFYCDCPAWKFQRIPASQRVCKHLTAVGR